MFAQERRPATPSDLAASSPFLIELFRTHQFRFDIVLSRGAGNSFHLTHAAKPIHHLFRRRGLVVSPSAL